MTSRVETILVYYREYESASVYDCIMAVADVSDLDNDELLALADDLDFGPVARTIVPLTQGNLIDQGMPSNSPILGVL